MNRGGGVTPRNYDLRNRIVSKLLPPSHFTPPKTIPTSSTGTTPTSRLTTDFQSLFDHGSTALSPPASNLGPVNQCPIDLTPSTFEGLSQLHEPTPISPVLVTPKSTLFTTNSLNIAPVTETKTFCVQPLTLKTPEQYSRSVNIFGNDRFTQTAVALNGLKPSVKRKDEVKQLKDEVMVANSKQNQDSNSCSPPNAHINVTRQPFYPRNTNSQPRARYFRQNTDNAPFPPAVPKSSPSTNY
ncbi:hypothetical protein CHS0354_019007 [Potamilus streckersoni]|uniref:Uncharacterized protein n=1 Tax=Potamilus streckersoni TaxID=2493646 RepID=A0AAE0SQK8_9BIVA|nr:hypothetical protein CHS0354_019007 [Potamilus streckersoni]